MRATSSKSLSIAERKDLAQMLAAPERVEIHGSDRVWRAGMLASVMTSACMTFGAAPAQAQSSFPAPIDPPAFSFFASKPVVPATEEGMAAVMRRDGVQEIASTAASVKPTVYALSFGAGLGDDAARQRVMKFATGKSVLEPALGGEIRLQSSLAGALPASKTPISWSYVATQKGRTGCVLLVSEQHAPALGSLARAAGLSAEAALDFTLMHEAAHCAQTGELLAAAYDLLQHGRVLPERIASGLLGAQLEEFIANGNQGEVMLYLAPGSTTRLSSERYADGFALLALMAQGRLTGRQVEGLIAWRLAEAPSHSSGSFLAFIRDEVRKYPGAFAAIKATRASGESGFDAQAIAGFLQPRWNAFEKAELDAYRESSAGLRDALVAGMKRREPIPTHSPTADVIGRGTPGSN